MESARLRFCNEWRSQQVWSRLAYLADSIERKNHRFEAKLMARVCVGMRCVRGKQALIRGNGRLRNLGQIPDDEAARTLCNYEVSLSNSGFVFSSICRADAKEVFIPAQEYLPVTESRGGKAFLPNLILRHALVARPNLHNIHDSFIVEEIHSVLG